MIYGIKSIKARLLSAISIVRADQHDRKHKHNSPTGYGYNSALRAVNGVKADNVNVSRRTAKIATTGLSLALLGQTAADYTSIAQTILQLMTIAIPIFVVIAVVRMIFRHLRD